MAGSCRRSASGPDQQQREQSETFRRAGPRRGRYNKKGQLQPARRDSAGARQEARTGEQTSQDQPSLSVAIEGVPMRRLVQRISFGLRGRRVPKRNPPPLRLEELETRTVLSAPFGLSRMPVFAGGGAALHFLEGLVAAGPGKSVFAPGHAREGDDDGQGLLVRQGGPSSAPVFQVLTITLTVPGNASPSN